MKNLLLFLFFCISYNFSYAQKTEYSVQLGSGFFSFTGNGAATNSYEYSTQFNGNGVGNPLGKKYGFSIFGGGEFKHINKANFLYGAEVNYESLTSKVKIDTAVESFFIYSKTPVNATSYYVNKFLSLSPFIGKRFSHKHLSFDLKAGADLAFLLSNSLKVKYDENATEIVFAKDKKPVIDFRIRAGVCTYFKNIGLGIEYSKGINNWYTNDYQQMNATSSFLRFSIKYLIKK